MDSSSTVTSAVPLTPSLWYAEQLGVSTRKRLIYAIAAVVQLGVAIGLSCVGGLTMTSCYFTDEDGKCFSHHVGVEALFRVGLGTSVELFLNAVVFTGLSFWALYILKWRPTHMVAGMLVGSTFLSTIMALGSSSRWGALSADLAHLNCTDGQLLWPPVTIDSKPVYCTGLGSLYDGVAVCISLLFVIQLVISLMHLLWGIEEIFHPMLSNGNIQTGGYVFGTNATDPLLQGGPRRLQFDGEQQDAWVEVEDGFEYAAMLDRNGAALGYNGNENDNERPPSRGDNQTWQSAAAEAVHQSGL